MHATAVDAARVLEQLDGRARAVAASASPAEAFRALLDAAALVAPRAAVFLVRQGAARGWSAVGHPPDLGRTLRELSCDLDEAWASSILSGPDASPVALGPGERPPFGTVEGEAVGIALRVRRKPIALVVLERDVDQGPWMPTGLSLVVRLAEQRLELDLARRKLAQGSGGVADAEPEPEQATTAAPASELAPAEAAGRLDPALDAARRFARLVATDIRLYNEEAVVLGRRHGDLGKRLAEALARGREAFEKRHAALGPSGLELLREAYVNVLAGGDASLLPEQVAAD